MLASSAALAALFLFSLVRALLGGPRLGAAPVCYWCYHFCGGGAGTGRRLVLRLFCVGRVRAALGRVAGVDATPLFFLFFAGAVAALVAGFFWARGFSVPVAAWSPGAGAPVLCLFLGGLARVRPAGALPITPLLPVFTSSALVARWLQALDARACSPKTIRNYAAWGQRLCARWPELSPAMFPECVEVASASLHRQGYSPTSIHGFQCAMASMAFCCWGWEPEQRQAMITARPVKPVHTVPNVDQVKALTAAMPEPYRTVALLCYCCGLRISEAIQVRLQDIDLVANTLAVMLSKGAKGRRVPIPAGLVEVLRNQAAKAIAICEADLNAANVYAPLTGFEYLKHPSRGQEPGQWPLFPQSRLVSDRRIKGFVRVFIHASKVERAFSDARKRTGSAAHITPHRLRDAFAVHSLINGVPVNVIQNLMGHATLETTAKYLSYLLTDEGAKLFPGLDLYKHLESA